MIALGVKATKNSKLFAQKISYTLKPSSLNDISWRKALSLLVILSRGKNEQCFKALAKRCHASILEMKEKDLRETVEAVANFFRTTSGEYDSLIDSCLKRSRSIEMTPRCEALLCCSLAKCGYRDDAWLFSIENELSGSRYNTWDKICILFSLAKLGLTNSNLQEVLKCLIKKIRTPSPSIEEGMFSILSSDGEREIDKRSELERLYLIDLAQLTWACCFHLDRGDFAYVEPIVRQALKKKCGERDLLILRMAIDLFNLTNVEASSELLSTVEESVDRSYAQEIIAKRLQERLPPSLLPFYEEAFIGYCPVDFLFPKIIIDGRQVVLEIDGPFHFTRPIRGYNGASQIKSRMIEKMNYKLIRIEVSKLKREEIKERIDGWIEGFSNTPQFFT